MSDPLDRIAFVKLPPDFDYEINGFTVDPAVALPIEIDADTEEVSVDDLTWDASMAAMLKLLAYRPQHDDAAYYRSFLAAAKPNLLHELTEAGIIKAHNGDFKLAEELFLSLIGTFPSAGSPALNLALAYEEHASALEREGEDGEADRLRAAAEQAYRRTLELDPLHADAHLNLAHFHITQRRHGEAVAHLEIYAKHGEDAEKRAEAERLLREIDEAGLADDAFAEAHRLIRSGEEARGLEVVDGFIAENGPAWQALFLRGWGLRRLSRYEEARDAFLASVTAAEERDLSEAPELADVFNELAICQLELDQLGEAASSLKAALARDPENTKILSNMGILAIKRGDLDEARRYFQVILDIDPNDPVANRFAPQLSE